MIVYDTDKVNLKILTLNCNNYCQSPIKKDGHSYIDKQDFDVKDLRTPELVGLAHQFCAS